MEKFKTINRAALAQLRTQKRFMMIINILLALGAAIYIFCGSIHNSESEILYSSLLTVNLGVAFFWACAIFGVFGVIGVFHDLYNLQLCDTEHATPLSSSSLFYSKLLTVAYLHILPMIFWTSIATIATAIISNVSTNITVLLPQLLLATIAGTLFTDAIAVVTVCSCGTFAESIYLSLIMTACISLLPYLTYSNILTRWTYLDWLSDKLIFSCWSWSFIFSNLSNSKIFITLTLSCIISIAVMLLAVFIYKRRDATSVGSPIVFRPYYEILLVLCVFTACAEGFFNESCGVIIGVSVMLYLAVNLILSRTKATLKSVMVWLLKYVAGVAACVVFAAGSYFTGGFGLCRSGPKTSLDNSAIDIFITSNDYSEDYLNAANALNEQGEPILLDDGRVRDVLSIYDKYSSGGKKTFEGFYKSVIYAQENTGNERNLKLSMIIETERSATKNKLIISRDAPLELTMHYDEGEHFYDWIVSEVNISMEDCEGFGEEISSLDYLYVEPKRDYEDD